MNTAFPLEPKRRLVMRRNWAKEPQEHQITRNYYRGRKYPDTLNPWIMDQLQNSERFNMTVSDQWRDH